MIPVALETDDKGRSLPDRSRQFEQPCFDARLLNEQMPDSPLFGGLLALRRGDDRSFSIDRAFDLAKSGRCRSVSEIIRHLRSDDRAAVEVHLARPGARRELIQICSAAWLAAD